ncbi:MAG: AAA family ATPase [Acholeplasmatales bacterium]|nr:AAA family ATPase [Acholeplasmatales bacterium]
MRIIKCHITNFGCYSDKTFDFSVKLNPYCLDNGKGKTTLATFIKAMFYSLEKSSTKSYERKHYKPYSGGVYGGSLEIELDNKKYRIERTFGDSPTKDTLKIYNGNGELQTTFLSKQVSLLQGENSSLLGELILGINVASFLRCNFISSNDLDFSSNESIKMKIGNIVIDREHENSFEDTYDSIVSDDLREKEPTARNNENAYPYRIKQLKKDNKDKQREIEEFDQLEENLQGLYNERDVIKSELDEIEKQQKALSFKHTQKGKLTTVEQYKNEIEGKTKIIEEITTKYNGNVPSKTEIDSLNENLDKYNECVTLDKRYNITPADISRLEELNEKVISDEDYELLADANSKLSGNKSNNGLIQIDDTRFNTLKNKFDGKNLKTENELVDEFFEYKGLIRDQSGFDSNYQTTNIDYPSENVLKHIESEIDNYNMLSKEVNDTKASYKEPSPFVKFLLIIFTLGIFLVVLNKKKKQHADLVSQKEKATNDVASSLNEFFAKYSKNSGTYELRLAELRDEINKYASSKNENEMKKQKYNDLIEKIRKKKESLVSYFILFGYEVSDVEQTYNQYKKDLSDYNNLKRDVERNEKIYKGIKDSSDELNKAIDKILLKNKIIKRDDFSKQLTELKDNLDFFKEYNPTYINKKSNDKSKLEYEKKIISIFDSHNISYDDIVLGVSKVINDYKSLNSAKEDKVELIEKKDKFIKDNNLEGFVAENVEQDEENLRSQHEQIKAKLDTKDDEINQNEERIAERDSINDEINKNLDLIEEYEEKVKIANLAAEALLSAQSDMNAKFIDPIKNSFVSYANKIYEKIGANVSMNYDYEIKYDVKGQLRESKDLSGGERAIMMLALRFAVLDSMYKNHDSLIILDDPFESLDPVKLEKAKEVIKELSNDWQILYFTCHDSRLINQ